MGLSTSMYGGPWMMVLLVRRILNQLGWRPTALYQKVLTRDRELDKKGGLVRGDVTGIQGDIDAGENVDLGIGDPEW